MYDGHQGDRAAQLSSSEIPRHVLQGLRAKGGNLTEVDALDVFGDAFKATDAQLSDMDDGTTACAVLVCKETVFVGYVGDSQAVICRLNTPIVLNKAHKTTDERERRRIESSGGTIQVVDGVERVNGSLNMSRALGNHKFRAFGVISEPSVASRTLTKGDDFLLLATDGLWNFVDPAQACQVMSSTKSAQGAATSLVNLALQRGSTDNVSVVVVDLRPLFGGKGFAQDVEESVPFNLPQVCVCVCVFVCVCTGVCTSVCVCTHMFTLQPAPGGQKHGRRAIGKVGPIRTARGCEWVVAQREPVQPSPGQAVAKALLRSPVGVQQHVCQGRVCAQQRYEQHEDFRADVL